MTVYSTLTHDVGTRLCALFGIEPTEVFAIDIHAKLGEPVTVKIERRVLVGEVKELTTERYEVVRRLDDVPSAETAES